MSREIAQDAPKLFSTSKKEHGTGFGLPLAVKIVQSEHGGSLTIESDVGVGTTVIVILPIKQRKP